jgi:hypothetical protein
MPRVEDYMLTGEELRLRARKRRRRIILGLTIVALAIAIAFGGRPAANRIKAWQARRHAAKAMQLIEQEKWTEARAEVTAAYQLRASEPEAIRTAARFLSRTRQAQALEFWDQLEKLAQLTPTDLRDEAAIALLAGDEVRAERAIRPLLDSHPTAADQLLAAQLAIRRNAANDAHDAIERVATDSGASGRQKLQAAVLELAIAAEHPDWRSDAWSKLKSIARGADAAALDALTVLAQSLQNAQTTPEGFPFSAAELARALETHPLARAPHQLLAKDLEIRDTPDKRDELMTAAVQQWKGATDPADVTALATWLNGKGEFQRVLDAIPLERALQTREVFLQYVDSLGGLGRWADIKQLLETERFPLDPVIALMYLARCNAQLGEKTAADNNWQRALEAAGGDAGKLISVAGYAEKNGAAEIARAAYEQAAAASPKLRVAQQGRLRIAQAQRDTKQLHAVLADMLKQWPNDTAVQNDEAYTRLLLLGGKSDPEELKAIDERAEQLVKQEPASLPHRTLLALVRLRQDRAADALHVYDNIQVAAQALTPSALAVHAAVLRANGNNTDADAEAKQIPANSLLPEEESLAQR